jgi:hypothetical protein
VAERGGDTWERSKMSTSFMSAMILPVQLRGLLRNIVFAAASLCCGRRRASTPSENGCHCQYSSSVPSATGKSRICLSSRLVQRCPDPSQAQEHPQCLPFPGIVLCKKCTKSLLLHIHMYEYNEFVHVASCQQKGSNAVMSKYRSAQAHGSG